jgi:hypothetical protein
VDIFSANCSQSPENPQFVARIIKRYPSVAGMPLKADRENEAVNAAAPAAVLKVINFLREIAILKV